MNGNLEYVRTWIGLYGNPVGRVVVDDLSVVVPHDVLRGLEALELQGENLSTYVHVVCVCCVGPSFLLQPLDSTHVFDDANKGYCVSRLSVILVAAQDESRGHLDLQVEVVREDTSLGRDLQKERENKDEGVNSTEERETRERTEG